MTRCNVLTLRLGTEGFVATRNMNEFTTNLIEHFLLQTS